MCSHGREDHIARFKFKFELWMQLERDRKKARPGGTKSVFMLLLHIPPVPVKFYKYAECARGLRPYLRLSARLLIVGRTRLILFDLPDVRKSYS